MLRRRFPLIIVSLFLITLLIIVLHSLCDSEKVPEQMSAVAPVEVTHEMMIDSGKSVLVIDTPTVSVTEVPTKPKKDGALKQVVLNAVMVAENNKPVLRQDDLKEKNTVYVVRYDFDLNGDSIVIPDKCVIRFDGGSLSNGTIIGSNTGLKYKGVVFDKIQISGKWNVPEIKTSMFADSKSCVNRLKDVIALTDNEVDNTVFIEDGDYVLEVSRVGEHLLPVRSNTTIILDGVISVLGNSFPRYRIISIHNVNNVILKGNGRIVGDKESHTYTPEVPEPESRRGLNSSHEYGHAVEIRNSSHISVRDISISGCIGDGVSLIGKDIHCTNLTIDNCRRQGISMAGDNIAIDSCHITNVWGVNGGGFGIDIEPDKDHTASNIIVSNCSVSFCNGGINCQCHAFESVQSVKIRDCHLSGFAKDTIKNHEQHRAFMCFGSKDIEFMNCSISDSNTLIYVEDAVDVVIRHNRLVAKGSRFGIALRKNRGNVTIDDNRIFMFESNSDKSKGVAFLHMHNATITNNEIVSDNLSYSNDTDCENVILRNNRIGARWEPGSMVNGCTIENNVFEKNVVIGRMENSLVQDNKMLSLKVRRNVMSDVSFNDVSE